MGAGRGAPFSVGGLLSSHDTLLSTPGYLYCSLTGTGARCGSYAASHFYWTGVQRAFAAVKGPRPSFEMEPRFRGPELIALEYHPVRRGE